MDVETFMMNYFLTTSLKTYLTMLGLILIYWIGKAFYDLAEKHNRTGWGHAIFGVAVYYIIQFIFAFLAVLFLEFTSPGFYFEDYEMGITLMSIPISALGCWGYYLFIKGRWENEINAVQEVSFDSELLDDDILLS